MRETRPQERGRGYAIRAQAKLRVRAPHGRTNPVCAPLPFQSLDPPLLVDTNLTFFREVLEFDEAEIQQETQNAFQFINEKFGLDFSKTEPNELGIRFF